jgi:hypothetical protein
MEIFRTLTFLLAITTLAAKAQPRYQRDYILTDTAINQGRVSIEKKGSLISYQRYNNAVPVKYGPSDVMEFATREVVYQSLSYKGIRQFFERVHKGKITLLKGRRVYIIKKDSSTVELTRQNFRAVVRENLASPGVDQSLSKLRFNDWSFRHFLRDVDSGKNNVDALDYRKVGLMSGFYSYHLNVSMARTNMSTTFSQPSIAVFAELPVSRSIYLGSEIHSFSADVLATQYSTNTNGFLSLKIDGLLALASAKWELAHHRLRPYTKGGLLFSSTSVESSTGLIRTTAENETIVIERAAVTSGRQASYGLHVGLGTQWNFHRKKTINLEMKFMKSFRSTFKSLTLNYSSLSILAGISI